MRRLSVDVAVVGGGPAGLAAGVAASAQGASTAILERNPELGGVLMQCIHPGFGLKLYGQELTGPEYACRWIDQAGGSLECLTDTMVLAVERRGDLVISASSGAHGLVQVTARAIVLAMGCRERTRGAVAIPGTRPAGIMTAGTAQRLVNIEGYMPGRRFTILGSGDIGMIMARRLTWEGMEVAGVYEIMPYLAGLRRNYVQCLQDYDIPLHLSHTVVDIKGRRRLSAVSVAPVGEDLRPRTGAALDVECDSMLLSVGLIPENELSRGVGVPLDPATGGPLVDNRMQTLQPGIFAAGNVVQVHDLADDVSLAGGLAGREAARQALAPEAGAAGTVAVTAGENVRTVVPQRLRREDLATGEVELTLRVRRPIEAPCAIELVAEGHSLQRRRLDYVRPGEMVAVKVGRRAAGRLAGDRLRVDVVAL